MQTSTVQSVFRDYKFFGLETVSGLLLQQPYQWAKIKITVDEPLGLRSFFLCAHFSIKSSCTQNVVRLLQDLSLIDNSKSTFFLILFDWKSLCSVKVFPTTILKGNDSVWGSQTTTLHYQTYVFLQVFLSTFLLFDRVQDLFLVIQPIVNFLMHLSLKIWPSMLKNIDYTVCLSETKMWL